MNITINVEMILANFDMVAYKRWLRSEYAEYRLNDDIEYEHLVIDNTSNLTDYLSDAAAQLLDEDADLENEFYDHIDNLARDYVFRLETKTQAFMDAMVTYGIDLNNITIQDLTREKED